MPRKKYQSIKFKYIFITLFVILIVIFSLIIFNHFNKIDEKVLSSQIDKDFVLPLNTIEINGNKKYFVTWIKPVNAEQISLHLNTNAKQNMRDFYLENSCKYLSNGGFYTTEDRPLGLFYSNNVLVSNFQNHSLMKGIFSADLNNLFSISSNINLENMKFAIQSGPILIINKQMNKFTIKSDKYARRVVVAITDNNMAIYLVFYGVENSFSGPLLSELPMLTKKFSDIQNAHIISAINLDGGSASAFVSDEVILEELKYCGSFFCIK